MLKQLHHGSDYNKIMSIILFQSRNVGKFDLQEKMS